MVSTNSNHFQAKYAKFLLTLVLTDLRDRGYKISYGRSSNDISRIGMEKVGGRVINTVKVPDTKLVFYLM